MKPIMRYNIHMIQITNVTKSYDQHQSVLKSVNGTFKPGTICLLYGRSGSGKTTLLNCLSGVELPEQGDIAIYNTSMNSLNENERANYRLKNIGIVYQFFNLLPSLTVRENILLPAMILKQNQDDHLRQLSNQFGIKNLLSKWPEHLSGGECQRVAICRALICKPKLILADEPTGNLDIHNRDIVMHFLKELTKSNELSIIIATHDQELRAYADQSWALKNGQLNPMT